MRGLGMRFQALLTIGQVYCMGHVDEAEPDRKRRSPRLSDLTFLRG